MSARYKVPWRGSYGEDVEDDAVYRGTYGCIDADTKDKNGEDDLENTKNEEVFGQMQHVRLPCDCHGCRVYLQEDMLEVYVEDETKVEEERSLRNLCLCCLTDSWYYS